MKFQSLSRDSWWSHQARYDAERGTAARFNPSVGILGGHTSPWPPQLKGSPYVSIPQSGFLVVTLGGGLLG